MYKVYGAGYGLFIFIIALIITLVAAYAFVKIPMHTIIEVHHNPRTLQDVGAIHKLPAHTLETQWQIEGNVPPLINMTDGGWLFFAEKVDPLARIIYQTKLKGASSVDFLTIKDLHLQLRDELERVKAENQRLRVSVPLEVIERVTIWLKRFEIVVLTGQTAGAMNYHGQNHAEDGSEYTDKIPVTMLSGNPEDIPDDDEGKLYKTKVKAMMDKEYSRMNDDRFTKSRSYIKGNIEGRQ